MNSNPQLKKISLRYFSSFAEIAGKTEEEYHTPAQTVEMLWLELNGRYAFDQPQQSVRPSINHQFCDWQTPINDRDIISFIPPVSGG